jgi:hypothetical protein
MGDSVRTYLVVIGAIEVLAVVEPQSFVQWGGVQAAIEEEQQLRIEASVSSAVGEIIDAAGITANVMVRAGEPVSVVRALIGTRQDIAALVLGAAPSGDPGLLVADFTGADAGKLPCPVMIIPGSIDDERLEQLS